MIFMNNKIYDLSVSRFSHTLNSALNKDRARIRIFSSKGDKYSLLSFYLVDCTSKAFASASDIGKGKRNVTFRVERERWRDRERKKERRCTYKDNHYAHQESNFFFVNE